jgi:serine/threonine protein kinase
MATVYLAHDVKYDRNVALKILRPELAAVIGAERFLQEIKVTANLQHSHILPLYGRTRIDREKEPSDRARRVTWIRSAALARLRRGWALPTVAA